VSSGSFQIPTFRKSRDFWQDLRYALRMLRLNPAFRAVALLAAAAFAVGIGAATSIYTVVNAVMLKPLPYRDARSRWRPGSRTCLHTERRHPGTSSRSCDALRVGSPSRRYAVASKPRQIRHVFSALSALLKIHLPVPIS
jgi:hypothetical protein